METLSDNQLERQDFVDNAIYKLIVELNPTSLDIVWNIEMIADIREIIQSWLVERLDICDALSFYPYIKE